MKWKYLTTWLILLPVGAALAVWQWSEYEHQCRLAFDELLRQAETVNRALVAGIRTHRRTGRFFEENLQVALNELVKSEIVLAVTLESSDGGHKLFAGDQKLLNADDQSNRKLSIFPYRSSFELTSFDGEAHGGGGGGSGGGGGGRHGGGRGWGRGPEWANEETTAAEDVGPTTETFHTLLILDSKSTEARCRREAWLRGTVVAASFLVLLCIALVWRATVRAVEARGRAKLYESETRQLRDLNQAAAGLAHETRNPLGLIRGWTQRLAQFCADQPEQRDQALAIVEECDRVTSRINQFLAFARPSDPQIETVAVAQLLDELAVLLEPDLEAKNLSLDRQFVDPAATVRADREMLRQILFNLVQNAIQFSPAEKTIEIAVRATRAGKMRIEVADRGPGVPDNDVESLFMPYFTSRADGTGLGLAIVRRIAMAHGWQSGYQPRSGGGSIFYLDQIDG